MNRRECEDSQQEKKNALSKGVVGLGEEVTAAGPD